MTDLPCGDRDPLARLFERVARHPERIAVSEPGRQISYGQFGDIVRRLAGALASHRSAAGETGPKVAILLGQGRQAYAAMFATLMAGGVYAPVNVDHPPARQAQVLAQFQPDIVLTAADPDPEAQSAAPAAWFVDPDRCLELGQPLSQPRPPARLAYVIFTSGSTGAPKGVMISRAALGHYLDWALAALAIAPGDVVSQHPNIGFDLSVLDIYAGLCGGATLAPLVTMKDRLLPGQAIRDHGVTVWVSVPSVVDLIRRAGHDRPDFLGRLRLMFFCGEPLLPVHLERLFAAAPGLTVINAYGPTEATVSCTARILTAADFTGACRANVAFGPAIPGMTTALVPLADAAGVAVDGGGDEGEIVLSGPQLADGYWNDPERTAAAFPTVNGQRRYHTGDFGRIVNGEWFFESRIDRQVKIRGFRLELGDVDAALLAAGAVTAHTVLHHHRSGAGGPGVADPRARAELVSFVEAAAGFDPDAALAEAQRRLPDYATPARIVVLETLPRSANDKIDHLALIKLLS